MCSWDVMFGQRHGHAHDVHRGLAAHIATGRRALQAGVDKLAYEGGVPPADAHCFGRAVFSPAEAAHRGDPTAEMDVCVQHQERDEEGARLLKERNEELRAQLEQMQEQMQQMQQMLVQQRGSGDGSASATSSSNNGGAAGGSAARAMARRRV